MFAVLLLFSYCKKVKKVLPLFSVRHLKGVTALFYSSCLMTHSWPFLTDVIVNVTAPIGT